MVVVVEASSRSPKKSVDLEEFFPVEVLPAVPPPPPVRLSMRQFFEASLLERHSAFDSPVVVFEEFELFAAAAGAADELFAVFAAVLLAPLFALVALVRQAGTKELEMAELPVVEVLLLFEAALPPPPSFFEAAVISVAEVVEVLER